VDQRTGEPGGGPDDRPGPLRRLSRRTSVWHYLVALALLPSIGVTAIAGLFTAERVDEARAAERIEHAATALRDLDALRLAVESEAGASVIGDTLAEYGTTPEAVNRIAGQTINVPLPQARKLTDGAVETVRRGGTPITAAAIDGIGSQIRALRGMVDGTKASTVAERRARSWNAITASRKVSGAIAALERTSTEAIVIGNYGPGSTAVLHAASQLEEISRVALLGGQRATAVFLLYIAPPEAVPGLVQELRDVDAAYRVAAAELPTVLGSRLRTSWQVFATGAQVLSFDELVSGMLAGSTSRSPAQAGIAVVLTSARSVGVFQQGLIHMLLDAVDGVTASAAADRADAVSRARTAAVLTAALLGLTIAVLLGIGGTIRWRLRDLANAAQRFSAGRLEPVTVRGPREIALASEGLNDAVVSLRRVTSTAEKLAAGDLSAPDLRHAAPGALGAAVHASVSRVADAIRERERLQQELTHQASHDALTGLANRAEGERLIAEALDRSRRDGTRIGLLFVDLDHFKHVNDTHGHHAGDHVLQVSAARMEALVRPRDVVCRFGGDEFVILLDPLDSEFAAIDVGEHLVAAISEPILYAGHELFVGASVGASTVEGGSIGVEELLSRSDSAVYRAKAAGRGGVVAH
jgi:diguanylate cyclase (GGDEF)-like protein